MPRGVLAVAIAAVSTATVIFGALAAISIAGPTPDQLREDIQRVDEEILKAQELSNRYKESSAISVQVQLRLAVLETTRSILNQKRLSWLRGITLVYTEDGSALLPPSPDLIADLERQEAEALSNAAKANVEASQYSGGLLLSLILVEEQTHLSTAAFIRQQIAMVQLGIRSPYLEKLETPLSQQVDDKGAL